MNVNDLTDSELSAFDDYDQHERVRRIQDPETGLVAFIGVHNRNLGPALGGCRMVPYMTEFDAIRDVLRLSRGMTYKNALAGLPLGGGKSVIIGDSHKIKTEELIRAMGRAVQAMGGRYITAEDSGTSEQDMITIAGETEFVVGLPNEHVMEKSDTSNLGGNPSPITAQGVFIGIKAAVRKRYGSESLMGLKVAVQGMGAVGFDLARMLSEAGAEVIISDIREDVLDQVRSELPDAHIMQPKHIFSADANVFAPCALGAQLNQETIPQMKFDIIAGAANNQLATLEDEDRLADKGILYVPDYAINSGGVISVAYEYFHRIGRNPFTYPLNRDSMMGHLGQISVTIEKIFALSESEGITTGRAADRLAQSIFMKAKSGMSA